MQRRIRWRSRQFSTPLARDDQAEAGYSLAETLAVLLVLGIALVGALTFFAAQNKTYIEQDDSAAMEQGLRVAMTLVTDHVRMAGHAVPSNLFLWTTWAPGVSRPLQITRSNPPKVSVAGCTGKPVARLTNRVAAGATNIGLRSETSEALQSVLNTDSRRLIMINFSEPARVKSAGSASITVDTNLWRWGNQGTRRAYPAGTPVCRVDILTFQISTDPSTQTPDLAIDDHDGDLPEPVAEGIADFQVTTTDGRLYEIVMTARAEDADPSTGEYAERALRSTVRLRN